VGLAVYEGKSALSSGEGNVWQASGAGGGAVVVGDGARGGAGVVVEGVVVLVDVGVLVNRPSPDFHLPVFGPPAQVTDRPAGAGTPGSWAGVASVPDAPAGAGMPGALARASADVEI